MANRTDLTMSISAKDNASPTIGKVNQGVGEFKTGVEGTTEATSGLTKGIVAFGVAAAAAFATKVLIDFGNKVAEIASVQERAELILDIALKNQGATVGSLLERYKAFAVERQKVTKFGDEQTLQAIALAVAMGKSEEETRRLIIVSQNLSEISGKDLTLSMKALLDATETGTISIRGLATTYGKGATSAEKFEDALQQLEGSLGGLAEQQALTFSGLRTQIANAFGDALEQIGSMIISSGTFKNVLVDVRDIISLVSDEIQLFVSVLGPLNAQFDTGKKSSRDLGQELKDIASDGTFFSFMVSIRLGIDKVQAAFQLARAGITIAWDFILIAAQEAVAIFAPIVGDFLDIIATLVDAFNNIPGVDIDVSGIDAAANALDQLGKDQAQGVIDALADIDEQSQLVDDALFRLGRTVEDLDPEGMRRQAVAARELKEELAKVEETFTPRERVSEDLVKQEKDITKELAKQLKLQQDQAKSFALLSDAEQSRFKFLLQSVRAGEITAENFAELPVEARKLIAANRQLQEEFQPVTTEFALRAGVIGGVPTVEQIVTQKGEITVKIEPVEIVNVIQLDAEGTLSDRIAVGVEAVIVNSVEQLSSAVSRRVTESIQNDLRSGGIAATTAVGQSF